MTAWSSVEDMDLAQAAEELRRRLVRQSLRRDPREPSALLDAVAATLRWVQQRRTAEGRQVGIAWVGHDGDPTTLVTEYTYVIDCLTDLGGACDRNVEYAIEGLGSLADALRARARRS